jgi:zinc/manganese transport system substrate-binding protein
MSLEPLASCGVDTQEEEMKMLKNNLLGRRWALAGLMLMGIGYGSIASGESPVLRVASFHPLLGDLARQVGGERVVVEDIVTVTDDPHSFEPKASDLARMRGVHLILVSGKGMENYLDKLRDNLYEGQEIVEVGRTIPSLQMTAGEVFVCCPHHGQGSIDPHWWHSPSNMKRAARVLESAFAGIDPAGKGVYSANTREARGRLDGLERWAKRELSRVPRGQRKLVTAHAAFGYFCKEFGFQSIPIQGLTREREVSARYLAEAIGIMQREGIRAVFPEAGANPKVLEEMVRTTGAVLGGELIADGTGNAEVVTYDEMMRWNVGRIVAALTPQ